MTASFAACSANVAAGSLGTGLLVKETPSQAEFGQLWVVSVGLTAGADTPASVWEEAAVCRHTYR